MKLNQIPAVAGFTLITLLLGCGSGDSKNRTSIPNNSQQPANSIPTSKPLNQVETPSETPNSIEKSDFKPESLDCVASVTDPFDPGKIMNKGPTSGQCIDASERRPAVILSETDDEIVFANFRHQRHFWIAHMPKKGVDQVIFQTAEFPVKNLPIIQLAHTQLRLIMKPGSEIKLEPQDPADLLAPTEIKDLILSDQTAAPHGIEYNSIKGAKQSFMDVLRIMSTDDRAKEELNGPGDKTRQFVLDMTDEQKDALLQEGIHESSASGLNEFYHLISHNCTTVLFNLLDKVMTYQKKIKPFKINLFYIKDPIEGPSIKALKKRHLIQREMETWNKETGLK